MGGLPNIKLSIEGNSIVQVLNTKVLGIYVDESLCT